MLLLVCTVMIVFRSYVFSEPAAFVLLFLYVFMICLKPIKIRTFEIFRYAPFYLQCIFIFYLIIRLDSDVSNDFGIVSEQILYLFIFSVTSIFSYNRQSNFVISLAALLYLVVFTVKVLLIFNQVKNGANLWSGFVIFLLIPLISMYEYQRFRSFKYIISVLPLFYFVFLIMVTARIPALSVIFFYFLVLYLPKQKNEMCSFSFFFTLFLLLGAVLFYSNLENAGIWGEINTISQAIFEKALFSGRHFIWKDLIEIIQLKPIIGHCSNCASQLYDASEMSRNLSSHNTFLELLLRVGLVGLIMFVAIYYSIWRTLFMYRSDRVVNVSAAFLLSSILFMSSGVLMFSPVMMCNALAWTILGLGYGRACFLRDTYLIKVDAQSNIILQNLYET